MPTEELRRQVVIIGSGPAGLTAAIYTARANLSPLLIDAPADMEAGRRAGVKTCAVRYGYGKPEDMACLEPDYWIDDLRALGPRAKAVELG